MNIERVNVEKRGRHYLVEGQLYPSVTNILGVLDKPALKFWAADIEREYVIGKAKGVYERALEVFDPNTHPDGLDVAEDKYTLQTDGFEKTLRNVLGEKKAHQMRLKQAGDIGSDLHKAIQARLMATANDQRSTIADTSPLDLMLADAAQIAFMAWEDWAEQVNLEPLHVERMLGSKTLKAGGTLDCAAEANVSTPGQTMDYIRAACVFDWKSSKRSKSSPNGIYPEAKIQVSVYRAMAVEMGLVPEDAWAAVVRLPKAIDDPCINEKKLDVEWIDPDTAEQYTRGFLSIRDTWNFMKTFFG